MQKHKWYNEIVAWASGAEIEYFSIGNEEWVRCAGNRPSWHEHEQYRIKPQPKEPQYLYLYVYEAGGKYEMSWLKGESLSFQCGDRMIPFNYIGKIKLEQDDV